MNIKNLIKENEHMYYFIPKYFDISFYNKDNLIIKKIPIVEKFFHNTEGLIIDETYEESQEDNPVSSIEIRLGFSITPNKEMSKELSFKCKRNNKTKKEELIECF